MKMLTIELTEGELEKYWPDFQGVAYAIYDEEKVHLYNHPKFPGQPYHIMDWTEQFLGSTLILFENYPTAIINIAYYKDETSLYSIVVHELFHGYQYLQGEKRVANEMLGPTYPISEANLELRHQERKLLHQGLCASTEIEKLSCLQQFISIREERQTSIGKFLDYENLVETTEGPAWYVELKAFAEKSDLSYHEVLQQYTASLLDQHESVFYLRRSCYSSGLALCLLLDECVPNWKDEFFQTEKSLYVFFKEKIKVEPKPVPSITISRETKELIEKVEASREEEILSLEKTTGSHVIIEGKITFSSIDPMNITVSGNRCLHKNFVKLKLSGQEVLFQQPVLTYFKDNIRNIEKIHLTFAEKPGLNNGFLHIQGVGKINAEGLTVSAI